MALKFIMDSQMKFQEKMGHNFKDMSPKERATYIKEHGYFVMEEVMEMFREMPFHKSWKDYSGMTKEEIRTQETKMKEEAIDALHFLINILISLGMDEEEVLEMYKDKNKLNYQRQSDSELGYVQSEDIK